MESRRADAAYQAYCWARVASDLSAADRDRAEVRRFSSSELNSASQWQRWVAGVPLEVNEARAIELAVMWARVAAVQPTEAPSAGAGG
jgi:hypothetical protein